MGSRLSKQSIPSQDYTKTSTTRDDQSLLDAYQSQTKTDSTIIAKDVNLLCEPIPKDTLEKLIERMSALTPLFTQVFYDEFTDQGKIKTVLFTELAGNNLESMVSDQSSRGRKLTQQDSWFVLLTLLVGAIELENKLDFMNNLALKTVIVNPDRSLQLVNPYMKDSHVKQAAEKIIQPILDSIVWSPLYDQSVHYRANDLSRNPWLKSVQTNHQPEVCRMLNSIGLSGLSMVSGRPELHYLRGSGTPGYQTLSREAVASDLQRAEQAGVDSDYLDLVNDLINTNSKSAVAYAFLMNPKWHAKLIDSVNSSQFKFKDPISAQTTVQGLKNPLKLSSPMHSQSVYPTKELKNISLQPQANPRNPDVFVSMYKPKMKELSKAVLAKTVNSEPALNMGNFSNLIEKTMPKPGEVIIHSDDKVDLDILPRFSLRKAEDNVGDGQFSMLMDFGLDGKKGNNAHKYVHSDQQPTLVFNLPKETKVNAGEGPELKNVWADIFGKGKVKEPEIREEEPSNRKNSLLGLDWMETVKRVNASKPQVSTNDGNRFEMRDTFSTKGIQKVLPRSYSMQRIQPSYTYEALQPRRVETIQPMVQYRPTPVPVQQACLCPNLSPAAYVPKHCCDNFRFDSYSSRCNGCSYLPRKTLEYVPSNTLYNTGRASRHMHIRNSG